MSNEKALSFSEWWCYYNNYDEWFGSYILGIEQKPSRPMILGNIIHSAIEGKNYKEKLREHNFISKYDRTIESILSQVPPFAQHEVFLADRDQYFEELGCKLTGIADGLDTKRNELYEIKTGSTLWTEDRVHESMQLTMYSWLYRQKFGKDPLIFLFTCNVETGKVIKYATLREEKHYEVMKQSIISMVNTLKEKDLWNKRISSKEKIQL